MAEIDERKALNRLGQAMRNLINGARPGTGLEDEEEAGAPAPGPAQPAETAPQALNPPPGQS